MKKGIWAIALLLIGILAAGAVWMGQDSKQDSVRLGAAVGLTGYCASWGEGELNAIKLAIAEANAAGGIDGKQIELVVEDMACDAKAAISAVSKLIDIDNVAAIVGPTWGDGFPAVFSVINERKVVSVSPSMAMESLVHDRIAFEYAFSTWFPQQGEIDALQKYIASTDTKNIVVLHDEDLFGTAMVSLFKNRATTHGLNVTKEYTFPIGFSDFRTSIIEIKSQKPEAIFAVFQDPATKAKFFKQAKELGLAVQFFSLTDVEDETLVANFAGALEGVIYTHARSTDAEGLFQENYEQAYPNAPIGLSGRNAYDATNALIEALRKTGGVREGAREALFEVRVPGTVTKEIQFNEKHQIEGVEFVIKSVRNGAFVELE